MVKGDKRLQIGSFVSANPIFTAPMAGITDRPFRDILHRMGAGLVFTEMVSEMCIRDSYSVVYFPAIRACFLANP